MIFLFWFIVCSIHPHENIPSSMSVFDIPTIPFWMVKISHFSPWKCPIHIRFLSHWFPKKVPLYRSFSWLVSYWYYILYMRLCVCIYIYVYMDQQYLVWMQVDLVKMSNLNPWSFTFSMCIMIAGSEFHNWYTQSTTLPPLLLVTSSWDSSPCDWWSCGTLPVKLHRLRPDASFL